MEKVIRSRPIIAISIGDINGIGPELVVKTFSDPRMLEICQPVIYASAKLLNDTTESLGLERLNINVVSDLAEIKRSEINLVECWDSEPPQEVGKPSKAAGMAALASLQAATRDLKANKTDALVTAPINKDTVQSDDFKFPGHTEYLTEAFGARDSLMMLAHEGLRVGVATGHIPLRSVAEALNKDLLKRKLDIFIASLRNDMGIAKPTIAVLGLNPHAGEQGLLGKEELGLINPLVEEFRSKGALVFGAYPADGFFGTGQYMKFDGILAMYHDQGLIPFKTLAFANGVNYTAGLNRVRTSPDHGTAYDIAGKGVADVGSFRQAIYMACDIVRYRSQQVEMKLDRDAQKPAKRPDKVKS